MTVLFTELNRIIFTALYRTFSTAHSIEFMVNDHKIFYGLIPLSFTLCNRINHVFFKSVGHIPPRHIAPGPIPSEQISLAQTLETERKKRSFTLL